MQVDQTTSYRWLKTQESFNQDGDKEPYSEKPLVNNHKHSCLGCSCEGRGWEAFKIFMETQLKRLLRLITFGLTNKYLAHGETYNDIYAPNEFLNLKNQLKSGQITRDSYAEEMRELVDDSDNYIVNLGHATQLLKMNGMTILTDPVFANLNWLLYPSKTRPGLSVKDLPVMDAIVISHNHRDHVDEGSLKKLIKKNPDMKVFVPEGDRSLFIKLGFKPENVFPTEWYSHMVISKGDEDNGTKVYMPQDLIDKFKEQVKNDLQESQSWWSKKFGAERNFNEETNQRTEHYKQIDELPQGDKQVKITTLPSKHWSGRNGFDNGESATNGYIASSKDRVVYFAGDTAMMDDKSIKQIAGKIFDNLPLDFFTDNSKKVDLLLPDGPNYTRSHMEGTHMSIIDGLKMSLDIAKYLAKIAKFNKDEGDNDQTKVSYWQKRINTTLIHHNKYELGPDRFNEGFWVMEEVLKPAMEKVFKVEEGKEKTVQAVKDELQVMEDAEKANWSVFLRKKNDWVYKGLRELIELGEEILKMDNNGAELTLEGVKNFITNHIDSVKNPKIGEKIDFGKDEDKVTSFKSLAEKYKNKQDNIREI